jgi:hypothetical protein
MTSLQGIKQPEPEFEHRVSVSWRGGERPDLWGTAGLTSGSVCATGGEREGNSLICPMCVLASPFVPTLATSYQYSVS